MRKQQLGTIRGQQTRIRSEGNFSLFKKEVESFMIGTLAMIRKTITDEKYVIEEMMEAIHPKLQRSNRIQTQQKVVTFKKIPQLLPQLQAAVQELNHQSQNLSQRLFDLSQQIVQRKLNEMQAQKQKLKNQYSARLTRAKQQFQAQKNILIQQANKYKVRCAVLEQYLDSRMNKQQNNSQKQNDQRKVQLQKYLNVIEQIAHELDILKNFSVKESIYFAQNSLTDSQRNQPSLLYSERRNYRQCQPQYDQVTHISQSTRPPTDQYSNQYYYLASNPNSNETKYKRDLQLTKRPNTDYFRPSSQSKQCLRSYPSEVTRPNLPPRIQSNHINYNHSQSPSHDFRNRSRSNDKCNEVKVRPIILRVGSTGNTPKIIESAKESELRHVQYRDKQHRKIQEKNSRMEAVQEKLHGLKRKLQKQLRSMCS